MLDFLIKYQRFIMLFLQGTCSFIAFLILITNSLCDKRKTAIFLLEVSAVLNLGAPIVYLTYEGVPGDTARWFLNISRFVTIHHKKFTKNRHYPLFKEIQM